MIHWMEKFKKSIYDFSVLGADDFTAKSVQAKIVYLVFFCIAALMSVLNIITARYTLLIATGAFTLICILDLVLLKFDVRGYEISLYVFMVQVIALFSYFIITGGTDNFSIIWLLLLPTLGLYFIGIRRGTIMSAIVLLIMLAFFYIPGLKDICTDYGSTFRLRFPIVFVFSFIVSLFLEYMRYSSSKALTDLRDRYQALYNHDALTGTLNRYGLDESFAVLKKADPDSLGLLMMDLDNFKKINDTYGHDVGDVVLKELSSLVQSLLPVNTYLHRWGGEEFIVLYSSSSEAVSNVQILQKATRAKEYNCEGNLLHITVSFGLITCARSDCPETISELVTMADNCLYRAKSNGRNRIEAAVI